jgi:hypothetical protein
VAFDSRFWNYAKRALEVMASPAILFIVPSRFVHCRQFEPWVAEQLRCLGSCFEFLRNRKSQPWIRRLAFFYKPECRQSLTVGHGLLHWGFLYLGGTKTFQSLIYTDFCMVRQKKITN